LLPNKIQYRKSATIALHPQGRRRVEQALSCFAYDGRIRLLVDGSGGWIGFVPIEGTFFRQPRVIGLSLLAGAIAAGFGYLVR
jgi:hypothetical protein